MARAGAAWVDVLPNLSLFNRLVNEGIQVPLGAAGTKAGREYGTALRTSTKASTSGIGAMVAAEMERGAAEAASAVDAAAGKVASARKREADAAGRLRVAEAKLQETRGKEGASASAIITAEERVAAAQRGVQTATSGATGATKSLERAQQAAAAQSSKSATVVEESGAKMSLFAKGAGKAKSAVAGLGKAVGGMAGIFAVFEVGKFAKEALTGAGDFQKSMNLLVTAGGENKTAIGLVSSGIKHMAVETGTSTTNLAEGMYTVEKASFRGADGLKVLRAAAQAAADEQVGLGVMTNGLTSIMRSYGIPASGVVSVTNELVAASGRAKSTMTEFAGSLSTVLPIASAAHISFAQVAGAVATLTSHGTSAQEATQHLAFAIRALQAPNMQAQKMMSQFGLDALDLSKNLGKRGLSGTLDLVSESILKRMGPSGIAMLKTFNQSKDAGKAATTMFAQLSPAAQKLATEFMHGQGSAGQFGKSVTQTLGGMDSVLAKSWLTAYSRSKGFNDSLKLGTATSKTYQGALTKIMGGAAGLNTALQLTGGSAGYLKESIREIGVAGSKTGNDISVWGQTQKTFNIQLSRFKEGIQVAGINLGGKLLPPLTTMLKTAMKLPGWVSKNSGALKDWAVGIGLLTAAFVVLDLTNRARTVPSMTQSIGKIVTSTKLWAGAQALLNVVMDANPISLIIVGIAALVVGFIYAYKHSETFRNIVHTALHAVGDAGIWMWNKALKPAFAGIKIGVRAVGDAAVWLWDKAIKPSWNAIGSFVGWLWHKAILPAFHGIETGVSAVGSAASWLWTKAIHPAFSAIGAVASWLWNKAIKPAFRDFRAGISVLGAAASWLYTHIFKPVFTVIGVVIKIAWNIAKGIFILFKAAFIVLGMAASWFYTHAVKPALSAVGSLIGWLWNKVAKPLFGLIGDAFHALGTGVKWVWDHVIHPAISAVGSLISWLWNKAAKPFFKLIGDGFGVLGSGVKWVWGHVISPTIHSVGSLIGWLWTKVGKPTFGLIGGGFHALGGGVKTVYDKVIHPVLKAFGALGTWLWTKAIKPALGFIADAFNALKKHIADPINFVITTIYDKGIRAFFNDVAKATGQSTRLAYIAPVKLAHGGPVRGPGTATSDSVPAMLSAGEYVMPARQTARHLHVLQALHRGQLDYPEPRGFAAGGVVRPVPGDFGRPFPSYPGHTGVDFPVGTGTAVHAVMTGVIKAVRHMASSYGNHIIESLPLAGNYEGLYAHLLRTIVNQGDRVGAGQVIGYSDSTGNSTGPHLHFTLQHPGGNYVDPTNFLMGASNYTQTPGDYGHTRGILDLLSGPLGKVKSWVSGLLGKIPGGGLGIIGQAMKSLPGTMLGWAKDFFNPFKGGSSNGGGTSAGNQTIGHQMMRSMGFPEADWSALRALWNGESGWNTHATNPSSGAYGIPQALPASKMASAGADWRTNPATQSRWGLGYIRDRYGSPSAAYSDWLGRNPHWYGAGTQSALPGWAVLGDRGGPELVNLRGGEQVMNASATRAAEFRTATNVGPAEHRGGVGVIDYDRLATAMARVHIDLDGRNVARSVDRRLGMALA